MAGSELEKILQQLQQAKHPEDAFGCMPGDAKGDVESRYKAIVRIAHPDRHMRETNAIKKMAEEAIRLANIFWDKAEKKFQQKRWGQKDSGVSIKASKLYTNVTELAAGDISDVYLAEQDKGPRVVIKVGYPADTDLMNNEARVLKKLWEPKTKAAIYTQQFLPKLLEQTKVKVDGKERVANIIEACEEGLTLEKLRERFPDGIDPRHAAWIWKRMVEGLTWVHRQGVVHGAILPCHLFVYPKNHGMCFLDWSYACTEKQALKAVVSKYKHMYPSEVLLKKPAEPTLDIYMIAQCVKYILVNKDGEIPNHTPPMFKSMIRACSMSAPMRIGDLGHLHDILTENLRKVYGPRKFVELNI